MLFACLHLNVSRMCLDSVARLLFTQTRDMHVVMNSCGSVHGGGMLDNSFGVHVNSLGAVGHRNSCAAELRGETKTVSTSTRCKVGRPPGKELAALQQAPEKLHVETWAGRKRGPRLRMSQEVEILPGCAVTGAVPLGSSRSCPYAYGRGPAIGPHTGERCWTLLASLWRAIAPLMKPWCAEGGVPTAANLNLYRGRNSRVKWQCDGEPLFGKCAEAKLILSVSFGTGALF